MATSVIVMADKIRLSTVFIAHEAVQNIVSDGIDFYPNHKCFVWSERLSLLSKNMIGLQEQFNINIK